MEIFTIEQALMLSSQSKASLLIRRERYDNCNLGYKLVVSRSGDRYRLDIYRVDIDVRLLVCNMYVANRPHKTLTDLRVGDFIDMVRGLGDSHWLPEELPDQEAGHDAVTKAMELRDSEELAYVLFKTDHKHMAGASDESMPKWDRLGETIQESYLAEVNAVFGWLFEYGRISQYISVEQLEEAGKEYAAYLHAKEQAK